VFLLPATGCVINGMECYSPEYNLQNCPHRVAAARELGIPIELAGVTSLDDGTLQGGLNILGVPVGDHAYEQHRLQAKSDKVASAIDATISLLRSVNTPALAALAYTLQSRADYWLQLASSPEIVLPMATQIDAALLRAVSAPQCEIALLITDSLVLRRIRLPARHKGLGLRQRTALAPRAWAASFIGAAESFIHEGAVKHGFFVGLTDLFGDGAFAKDGHRFATFLQSDVPYARALERACGGERSRLGLDNWDPAMPLPKGPLSTPVDMAGIREEGGQSLHLQHAICEQAVTGGEVRCEAA